MFRRVGCCSMTARLWLKRSAKSACFANFLINSSCFTGYEAISSTMAPSYDYTNTSTECSGFVTLGPRVLGYIASSQMIGLSRQW